MKIYITFYRKKIINILTTYHYNDMLYMYNYNCLLGGRFFEFDKGTKTIDSYYTV